MSEYFKFKTIAEIAGSRKTSNIKHDYIIGDFHEKSLRVEKVYGNCNKRYIEFKDEDGIILTWYTNDRNKSRITTLKGTRVTVRFKVKDIYVQYNGDTTIWIGYARRILRPKTK